MNTFRLPYAVFFFPVVVISLYLLCIVPARAAVLHDPGLSWKTLQGEHFLVHFHDGEEGVAKRVLAIAEAVHTRLLPFFQWTPQDRTEIVLTDRALFPGGFASTRPRNRIKLHLLSPAPLGGHEEYLQELIAHEYAHTLHLDRAKGLPNGARSLFGRLKYFFPNQFQPLWGIEGIASYASHFLYPEKEEGIGNFAQAMMRMEYLAGLKPLRQINQPMATWPSGTVPYLYGEYIYRFLADTRGEDSVENLIANYSDNLLPFFINTNAEATYDKNLSELYDEFQEYLKQQFEPQIEAIRARGLRTGEPLTHHAGSTNSLIASGHKAIYYLYNDDMSRTRLYRRSLEAKQATQLMQVDATSLMDIHEDRYLLVLKSDWVNNTYNNRDVYVIDLEHERSTQLTFGRSVRAATWSPDGLRFATLEQLGGHYRLNLFDKTGKFIATLWQSQNLEALNSLDWSPDGKHLLSSVWREQRGWELEEFSLDQGLWKRLTYDSAAEANPRYSSDAKYIIYAAEYRGVYNLHRYALQSGKIQVLTNVLGAALSPVEVGENVFYLSYGNQGFDIYRLNKNEIEADEKTIDAVADVRTGNRIEVNPDKADISDYRVDYRILPTAWIPQLNLDEDNTKLGFKLQGSDALHWHTYTLRYVYDIDQRLAEGDASYVYDRWYPQYRLRAKRKHVSIRDADAHLVRIRRNDSVTAEVVFPWLKTSQRWAQFFSVIGETVSDARRSVDIDSMPGRKNDRLGAALIWDTSVRFKRSISQTDGRSVALLAETASGLDSDFPGDRYRLDWREYVDLGKAHVLAARVVWAKATGRAPGYLLGGQFRPDPLNIYPSSMQATLPEPGFDQSSFALRGYASGIRQLSGQSMALASVEWRFPLFRLERGLMAPPIGLEYVSGLLFYDIGDAWNQDREYHRGVGAELLFQVPVWYQPSLWRLGFADGLDNGGERKLYTQISIPF